MNRHLYFDYLRETSAKVSPVISQLVEQIKIEDMRLYDVVRFFVDRRLNKPLMKPALLRLCFELCGSNNWQKIIPAAAAFELLNISSYQANTAFDHKLGIFSKEDRDAQFIAAMISLRFADKMIRMIRKDFASEVIDRVCECLSDSNLHIYIAQHIDLFVLTYEEYQGRSELRDEKRFLMEYERRCFHGSGYFTGQCALAGAILAEASPKQTNALRRFGEQFGTALHMINDIGDFVLTGIDEHSSRDYQDQYSDIENGRITLPTFHVLRHGSIESRQLIEGVLENRAKTKKSMARTPGELDRLHEITFRLVQEGSIDYVHRIAKGIAEKATQELDIFPRTEAIGLLKTMASVILCNKYTYASRSLASLCRTEIETGEYSYVNQS